MLAGQSQSSGGTVDGGAGQLVDTSGGGFWRVEISAILKTQADVLAAEAWQALIGSGVQSLILPLRQARSQVAGASPAITLEANAYPARVDFNPADYTDDIWVNVVAPSAVRATSVTLDCDSAIYAGRFSVEQVAGTWRMYELVVKGAVDGAEQTFESRPPLREAFSGDESAYMSYCFLTVRAEPGSFNIKYDSFTKGLAVLQVKFVEVR
jgi:hypothetical protein